MNQRADTVFTVTAIVALVLGAVLVVVQLVKLGILP